MPGKAHAPADAVTCARKPSHFGEEHDMSILGSIMTSILGSRAAPPPAPQAAQPLRDEIRGAIETAAATPAAGTTPAPEAKAPAAKASADKPATGKASAEKPPAGKPAATAPPTAAAPGAGQVDIAAVLDKRAGKVGQKLDWRKSIVDLMKLLELDSSQSARKQLAQELAFKGDTKDSAAMNVWLHKEVMRKLSEHGGKVPPELVKH
jgi:hypothetical protein